MGHLLIYPEAVTFQSCVIKANLTCLVTACSSGDREMFNENLLGMFAKEARLTQTYNVSHPAAAQWKFRQLDRDTDQTLDSGEYRDLKRLVKRLVEPRACARNFIKFSDRDNNEVITEREWMISLGVHGKIPHLLLAEFRQ